MSSVIRAGPRGGKGAAKSSSGDLTPSNKAQKTETTKTDTPKASDNVPKGKNKGQNNKEAHAPSSDRTAQIIKEGNKATAEQMRLAQIIDTRTEDPDMKNKIKQVMDATRKSEDEVCTALHDCDNDLDRAVNMLLEGSGTGEWETSGKKKKTRNQAGAVSSSRGEKSEGAARDRSEPGDSTVDRERSRTRGGGPPRMRGRGSSDSRGWRGRENKENEKNLQEEGGVKGESAPKRGAGRMANGPGRSGRGGRGGGRSGPRTFQGRGEKGGFPKSIETWDPHGDNEAETNANGADYGVGEWNDNFPVTEDWDNEEYTGSLADTKVFTPSTAPRPSAMEAVDAMDREMAAVVAKGLSGAASSLDTAASMLPQSLTTTPNKLTPAQSQYFSQLTQVAAANESLKAAVGVGASSTNGPKEPISYVSAVNSGGYAATAGNYQSSSPASYSATAYGGSNASYSSQIKNSAQSLPHQQKQTAPQSQQNLQSRPKVQRTRLPPPSKIPSSAVEMPGDATTAPGLDVQFGGLEFGSDSFELSKSTPESNSKYKTSSDLKQGSGGSGPPLDLSSMSLNSKGQQAQDNMTAYSSSAGAQTANAKDLSQTSLSAISHSQKLGGTDSMTFPAQVSDHKAQQQSGSYRPPVSSTGIESAKPDNLAYSNSNNTSSNYQSSYQKSYQSGSSYPSSGPASGYSSQVSSSQYPSGQTQGQSYSSGQSGYGGNQSFQSSSAPTTTYSQTSSTNTYHQSTGGNTYQAYPSIGQTVSAATSSTYNQQYPQSYITSGSGTAYTAANSTQYPGNYGSNGPTTTTSSLHSSSSVSASKMGSSMASSKDGQYDAPSSGTTSSSTTQASASQALGLTSTGQSSTASTKVTSSTAGVPPAMLSHQQQYIMGQGQVPYFNVQQPIYSFDDFQHQMLSSRVPMQQTPGGYYDISSLTGRDSGMTSVAYSVSGDGRYTRTDNNSSPVPSTLSQQNATPTHQQPMLNPTTLPPGYAYFYGANVVPGSFQYSAPLYPLPTPATNTHAATNSTQYAKPAGYTGFGTSYDSLAGQGAADYSKSSSGYVNASSQGGQSGKGSVVGSGGTTGSATGSASDITSAMYGKPHPALGKVNSYDKQSYSAAPQPFSLPASQTGQIGAGATQYAPLFIPAMPQQMHQQLHQMEYRNQGRRSDSGTGSGQRSQTSSQQNKTSKQGYNTFWTQN
ncbi:protein lingerer isoform X4 [Cloeon dipterum]|uniref:protein lingerer isoform X4 n=1 Tax=Cloeon dipterum TaxID=197152 RepID=UPI0032207CDC